MFTHFTEMKRFPRTAWLRLLQTMKLQNDEAESNQFLYNVVWTPKPRTRPWACGVVTHHPAL